MITKNELAKNINAHIAGISRTIDLNWEEDYQEGQVIVLGKAESWTDGGEFTVETEREFSYTFVINNEVPCHVVDYTNKEEVEVLGAEECEREKEVLLPAGTKLEIVYVSTEDDYKEMGYYIVELEYVEEEAE